MAKNKHGGKRIGAGAKPKEKTKVFYKRVPESKYNKVVEVVNNLLNNK